MSTMSQFLALTGPPGTGKSTLGKRLQDIHGFTAVEGSRVISDRAKLLGHPALITREDYEGFFRREQMRSGMSWISGTVLSYGGDRLAHIGLRSKYDLDYLHSVGGLVISLFCEDISLLLSRLDSTDPKNPATRDEYAAHRQLQNSPDEFGSHLDLVMSRADFQIDVSMPMAAVNERFDEIVTEVTA